MNTTKYLFSGFGGQGILFIGKLVAYKGLIEDKQVSWLPSYGPEMRGGTASCSVIVSDNQVGSPIVSNPDILVAMNLERTIPIRLAYAYANNILVLVHLECGYGMVVVIQLH